MRVAGLGLFLVFSCTGYARSQPSSYGQIAEQIESEGHICICQDAERGLGKLGTVKRSTVYGAEGRMTCSIPSLARSEEGEIRYVECSRFIFVPGH